MSYLSFWNIYYQVLWSIIYLDILCAFTYYLNSVYFCVSKFPINTRISPVYLRPTVYLAWMCISLHTCILHPFRLAIDCTTSMTSYRGVVTVSPLSAYRLSVTVQLCSVYTSRYLVSSQRRNQNRIDTTRRRRDALIGVEVGMHGQNGGEETKRDIVEA